MFKRYWILRDEELGAPSGGGTPPEPAEQGNFEPAMLSESEEGEGAEPQAAAVPATPAAEPAPGAQQPVQAPPSAAPAVQQPPVAVPAAPQAAPQAAPAPAQAPAAVQPPAPTAPPDPAARGAALAAARDGLVKELETRYALTEEQGTSMMTEPEKVLPGFAARLFVDVYEAVFQQITAQIPVMYQDLRRAELAQGESERAFYQQWPALNKPEYTQTVNRLATQYMQLNPGASREQAFNEIGQLAHISLKVPFEQAPAPAQPPPATRPFVPAAPGATSAPGAPAAAKGFYEQLAEEFERMDN